MTSLPLHTQRFGGDSDRLPLVLLHGLFGASGNWQAIARYRAAERAVLVPDLRNHGASHAWSAIEHEDDSGAVVAVESQLHLRLAVAQRILDQVAEDAPQGHGVNRLNARTPGLPDDARASTHHLADEPADVEALPLAGAERREDADRQLRDAIPDARVRGFLLQNLRRTADGWRWRCNLDAIADALPALRDFPDAGGRAFPGPAWFLYGTASAYVGQAELPAIRSLFPLARLRAVPNAGHWVQTDQPEAFIRALTPLLRVG